MSDYQVFEGKPEQFYMDRVLIVNLQRAKDAIKKDWDMIFAVDGDEGSGKSVLAQQMGFYCDPTLTVDRITFNDKEFRKAIMDATQYQCVIYDEAYTGLGSRSTMSLINRTLVSMLAEIRQKNLFVFIVMPSFFDLDKYVALHRSRALIHVYTMNSFERGYFAFYNKDKKKSIYITGKKYYNYGNVRKTSNFSGRFTNHYCISEKEYRKKKHDSLNEREANREKVEHIREVEEELFTRVMLLGDDIPHKLRMSLTGLPQSTYFLKLKKWRESQ